MLAVTMRIIRFMDENGRERWGTTRHDESAAVIEDRYGLLSSRPKLPTGATVRELVRSGEAFAMTAESAHIDSLLAPALPVNVLCAGRNYRGAGVPDDAAVVALPPLELFMKPTTALQHPHGPIILPASDEGEPDVDAEGELAVLIGATLRNATEKTALDAIVGCTIALDVTDRRWQTATGPPLWMRGKGFDTFCPIGPALVTVDEVIDRVTDADGLPLHTSINGQTVRAGTTGWMVRSVAALIAEISRMMTILPGTLLLTGAPTLVAATGDRHRGIRPGDVVEATIDGIGTLTTIVQRHVDA